MLKLSCRILKKYLKFSEIGPKQRKSIKLFLKQLNPTYVVNSVIIHGV